MVRVFQSAQPARNSSRHWGLEGAVETGNRAADDIIAALK
jgi:hypothetical protein